MAENESSMAAAQGAFEPERKVNGTHPDRMDHAPHHQSTVSQVPGQGPPVHRSTVSQVANPEYMKLANPGPLGLLAFAITTFVVGLYECGAGYEWLNSLSCSLGIPNFFADCLTQTRMATSGLTRLLLELWCSWVGPLRFLLD